MGSVEFQREIDERMLKILAENSIEYVTLHGSVDDRLAALGAALV